MVDRLANSQANAQRIAFVEKCFGNSGQPLALPGRVLVGESLLIKMCRKKPKERQFFLFNDILVYGSVIISKRSYSKQHVISLDSLEVEDLPDDGEFEYGFQIKTPTKSFNVYAPTKDDKTAWMHHLKKCVDDLLEKRGDERRVSKEKAAVWVPDPNAVVCMHCNKTKFSLIQRRHHCRKCGSIVCNACSTKRFSLTNISNIPVRVCDMCFVTLINKPEKCLQELKRTEPTNQTEPKPTENDVDNLSGENESTSEDEIPGSAQEIRLDNHDKSKFYEKYDDDEELVI